MEDNKENAEKAVTKPINNILLPDDQDYLITRMGTENYNKRINLTFRSPRKREGSIISIIETTSINLEDLNALRLEEIDGQVFVVNDAIHSDLHQNRIKLSVCSTDIGFRIIQSMINEYKPEIPKSNNDARNQDYLFDRISSVIGLACAVLVCTAVATWLFSHA